MGYVPPPLCELAYGSVLCTDGETVYWADPPKTDKPRASETCGGCGSREILIHNGQRICPYCRGSRE